MIRASNLSRHDRITHGFFTRQGGVSDGVYASLNCGYGSGDGVERVRANRQAAMALLGFGADDLATAYQVHSATVARVERPWAREARPKADALVTDRPGVALGIMTADCAPVLLADAEAGVIGAAHAGWRGALDGVLAATVEAMEALGAARGRIAAALGPCIRQPSYEVGPEFQAEFVARDAGYAGYFSASTRPDHFMFDLAGFVRDRLTDLDLGSVDDVNADTYADGERFFSYRRTTHRGEADYGRGLSAVVLKGSP